MALLISFGLQKSTFGLVSDWTPVPDGTVLQGLWALLRGRDMKGNLVHKIKVNEEMVSWENISVGMCMDTIDYVDM